MSNSLPARYQLQKNGEFVIHGYNLARPMASFFPGIAGLFGIPLWVFYVNRGQCIASFGIRSKDEAIMEFLPANKAFQLVSSHGFRTFIKIKQGDRNIYYEPFSLLENISSPIIRNKMVMTASELKIVEHHPALGLEVEVSYFSLPNEPFAALVREVVVTNVSRKPMDLELLDGLSIIVPHGVNNFFLKEMSRTIEAWMKVEHTAGGITLYKLTTDPRDTAQVSFIKGAHFYMGFEEGYRGAQSRVIVDPAIIFGHISDFSYPINFLKLKSFVSARCTAVRNKTPCAFSFIKTKLAPGAHKKFFSLIGHIFDADDVKKYRIDAIDENFISAKRLENRELIDGIMDRIFTSSGLFEFDLYARQTYLDNVLRGGLPHSISIDGVQRSIYVFSRKHGDLERDYNKFLISATQFSEGEGNYRDVIQNRRCDVFLNPLLREKNIVDFMNLIQLDGYNPLVFRGEKFIITPDVFQQSGLSKCFHEKDAYKIAHILSKPFMLGEILHYIQENKIFLSCPLEEFVKRFLAVASSTQEALYGEGYWSDHWTYNTDLLESFQALYPDLVRWLLFEKDDFTYFDTHVFVKPRSQRYVVQHKEIRQYHAIGIDEEKYLLIQKRQQEKDKVRTDHGGGSILNTTLIVKFLCLILNKLATLDPFGVGIEMEADKPNWYDALNGLPALFGSSISETFELKRLIMLLKDIIDEVGISKDFEIAIFSELHEFYSSMLSLLKNGTEDCFGFWDRSNVFKESYRFKVRRGVSNEPSKKLIISQLLEFFELALKKLNAGIEKSYDAHSGFYHTYFMHQMVEHDTAVDEAGKHGIVAKKFKQVKLPLFLEGFMHALRTEHSKARDIYGAVRRSPLFDAELKMYKVNASLKDESFELGRAKVFTPGWLENESIWMHMEYKFLLELLKNQLYDEFYKDFFDMLIPFQRPKVYGRSILENSSFIVSSAHPDVSLHGAGFVARLSGSTAEFIHMWLLMNVGPEPFFLDESGKLSLRLRPILSKVLFTKKSQQKIYTDILGKRHRVNLPANTYGFLFLGKTLVVYSNPRMKNTFGKDGVRPVQISLFDQNGLIAQVKAGELKDPYAALVRSGAVGRIEVLLGK